MTRAGDSLKYYQTDSEVIQKVAQMIGITLLSYGLAGIKMLSCFFAIILALSAALVPHLYLSWVEQILSTTQFEIPTIRAASLQQTKVTSVYAEQTREEGKHRRIHTPRHKKILQVNNGYQNQSSVIRKY